MLRQRASEVGNAFQRALKTGNRDEIAGFSVEDLEMALQDYSRDSSFPWYKAMEQHLASLQRKHESRTDSARRRKDLLLAGLVGIAVGVLGTVVAEVLLIRLGVR